MKQTSRKIRRLGQVLGYIFLACGMAPTARGSHRVLLTWDPNPEPDIAGYRIHYGTNSRVHSVILDVHNVTNTIVTNLASETTYYFAATAYKTSSLESDLSEEVSLTTPTPNPPVTNQARTITLRTRLTAKQPSHARFSLTSAF